MIGQRIFQGIWWSLIWGAAGAVIGFYGTLSEPSQQGMVLGAGLAGGLGFIYGLILPGRSGRRREQQPRSRFSPVSCAWCKGRGVVSKARNACQVCGGQGHVLVPQPNRRCGRCKGKGRRLFGRRCNVCDGAGWATYVLFNKFP